MLLTRSPQVDRLLRTAWEQTAFIPNRVGPAQHAMSARLKWNRTLRTLSPFFHTAGCSMNQKARTCADWLRFQLDVAQSNWEGRVGASCLRMSTDVSLPRPLKGSDAFIPFGQGRDVIVKTEEATRLERAAVMQLERRACLHA